MFGDCETLFENVGDAVDASRFMVSITGKSVTLACIVELNVALDRALRDDIFFGIGVGNVELLGERLKELACSKPRNLMA